MRRKILLAEDSVTIQKVFELALARSDVTLVTVENGDDAVRAASEAAFDLVIADLTLPGKDGFEVASAISERESTRELPVLILSGAHIPLDEGRLKASGAKGVLFKPFDSAEMLEKVEDLLRKPAAAPPAASPEPPPAVDEHWNFSDVLDEVEEPAPAQALPAVGVKEEPPGYDEFDVSIDDIEEPPPVASEGELAEIEEIEELEEIEEIPEEIPEGIRDEVPVEAFVDSPVESPAETPEEIQEAILEEVPEMRETHLVQEMAEETEPPLPPYAPPAVPADEALEEKLKEQFAARAEAVFRDVASEAVEKAMWEMMDRLAGEFSARIRESVEAVAWEVIPATAEALIREEISRIRTQAG
ncbi:MAG: response regulator, partial [Thermodesulfobacteriota bacterium]